MVYETDERLKSYLDTNQMAREQMCLAVMANDRRFSNVQPRHPRGGPDGARDIRAGICTKQWENRIVPDISEAEAQILGDKEGFEYKPSGSSTAVGEDRVKYIRI